MKKRVKYLRNKKLHLEAQEINDYASRRQVEKLYRSFKSENSCFKEIKSTRRCDPSKLKQYFQKHFSAEEIKWNSMWKYSWRRTEMWAT